MILARGAAGAHRREAPKARVRPYCIFSIHIDPTSEPFEIVVSGRNETLGNVPRLGVSTRGRREPKLWAEQVVGLGMGDRFFSTQEVLRASSASEFHSHDRTTKEQRTKNKEQRTKNKEQRTMWLHLGVRMNQENDGFSQTWRPPGPAKIPIPLAVRKPPFTPLKSHLGASWWTLQGVTGNLHMRKGLSGRSGASRAFSRHGRSVYILGALQSSEALRAPLKYGFLKSNSKCA
jgi:hypothetical protein